MIDSAFAGKVALVTGAASGIGRATALAFAHEGARVVLADRDEAGAEETARLIEAQGGDALVVYVDVAQEASVAAMMARAVEAFGRVDLAVNSAGVASGGARFADFEEAAFDRLMAVNLKGVFLCVKHQLRQMAAQGGGAIVNIGSIASFSGMGPGRYGGTSSPAYIASKHAVVGLTRAAAVDYARDNVRVNAVCPGVVRTPMYQATLGAQSGAMPSQAEAIAAMHPLGRLAEVEEVAEAVLWLCSDKAGFVTGHMLAVDGGFGAA